MFGLRKRVKALEQKVRELESNQKANSYLYGAITLQDVVRILEKNTAGKTDGQKG